MCITQDEVRKVVHDELDKRILILMEHLDKTINDRVQHHEPSQKTIGLISALEKKLDKIIALQEGGADAIQAVNTILNGSRLIKWIAQFVGWTLIIFGGVTAFKMWVIK